MAGRFGDASATIFSVQSSTLLLVYRPTEVLHFESRSSRLQQEIPKRDGLGCAVVSFRNFFGSGKRFNPSSVRIMLPKTEVIPILTVLGFPF